MLGVVVFSLLLGVGIGYAGYEWLHRLKIFELSRNMSVLDSKIKLEVARARITALRQSGPFMLDLNQSWEVKRTTFDAILSQVDTLGVPLESIQFYPAYAEDGKSLTLVLVGRSPNGLVLKQQVRNAAGGTSNVEGEIWDYIGPCPPYQNCPKNEELLAK